MENASNLEEFTRLISRRAAALQVGGFRPTNNLSASNFGRKPLALPEEPWPAWNGEPLLYVCQLNLMTAPIVPKLLEDIKLITFFVAPKTGPLQHESGKDWRLCAYKSLLDLVPLAPPENSAHLERGFECRWEECADYPTYEDPELQLLEGFEASDVAPLKTSRAGPRPAVGGGAGFHTNPCPPGPGTLENVHRTKIGGYPSHIQSELWWEQRPHPAKPKFCFQIDSEKKAGLMWGDSGMIYLARGTAPGYADRWFLDWQCY